MDKFLMIKEADRYFNNEMTVEEKREFESNCANSSELRMIVDEHKVFLNELNHFVERKELEISLSGTYAKLVEKGLIKDASNQEHGKIFSIFHKYKKVTAIAASIAGFTALVISGTMSFFGTNDTSKLQQLSRDIEQIKKAQVIQSNKIQEVASKVPKGAIVKSGGSAFMIDSRGYLVTNAHVLSGSGVIIANTNGQEYSSNIVYIDQARDLALLKITDKDFHGKNTLPYSIRRTKSELGQDVFTLGFPRNDIEYNTGYISAASGFDGDTSSIQLNMAAHPGNSGGPLFNSNGDVIGVISTKERKVDGVSFAIKTNQIFQMLDDWSKTDTSMSALKIKDGMTIYKKKSRVEQIKELERYVYLVKVY